MALASIATVGLGPALSMTMVYQAMADSIGMVMHNAETVERNMQSVASAATGQACVLIIAKGAAPSS